MLTIRPERPGDHTAIRHVHRLAFGQAQEAELVDVLRRAGALTISLVATQDANIVGHIAFSPVTITSPTTTADALGLAPMGVLPAYQRQGVGAQLANSGLQICRETGYGVVVVLGHPNYYTRFGFTPAKPHGITWEHDVPDDVFMVQELQTGALPRTQGVVKYQPAFDAV